MSIQTSNICELPKFTPTNVEFWFKSVELIFTAALYSDDEMYDCLKNYLLDNQLLTRSWNGDEFVTDAIPDFNPGRKYVGLKKHFLDAGYVNISLGLDEVISSAGLFSCRDLRPSAFLTIMNTVFHNQVPMCIKRTFWMARLPQKVKKIFFLTVILDPRPLDDRSLEDLAAIADGIAAYEKYHSQPRTDKPRIKIPTFTASDPELWFYSLDEAFSARGIVDDQLKFEYTMHTLQFEELLTAAWFLTDLPNQTTENKYANLKERIIKTFDVIKNYEAYNYVFRITMLKLKPYPLLKLLNDMAVKCNRVIPHLLIRTFWIMLLPIRTQGVLFQLWTSSRETLQDLDVEALGLVADGIGYESLGNIRGCMGAPDLDNQEVDNQVFNTELQAASSFQEKIAFGMKYCDFMYRTYYKNNPSESIEKCTRLRIREESEYTARDFFFEGCDCWYHERFGESAKNCIEVMIYN